MNLTICLVVVALVVCVALILAVVLFCALALATQSDRREAALNEFLRRGSEPEMDWSTYPPTYKRLPRNRVVVIRGGDI